MMWIQVAEFSTCVPTDTGLLHGGLALQVFQAGPIRDHGRKPLELIEQIILYTVL